MQLDSEYIFKDVTTSAWREMQTGRQADNQTDRENTTAVLQTADTLTSITLRGCSGGAVVFSQHLLPLLQTEMTTLLQSKKMSFQLIQELVLTFPVV